MKQDHNCGQEHLKLFLLAFDLIELSYGLMGLLQRLNCMVEQQCGSLCIAEIFPLPKPTNLQNCAPCWGYLCPEKGFCKCRILYLTWNSDKCIFQRAVFPSVNTVSIGLHDTVLSSKSYKVKTTVERWIAISLLQFQLKGLITKQAHTLGFAVSPELSFIC